MLLLAQSNLVQVRDVLQLVEMLIGTQFLASQWSISNVLSICWLLRSQTLQVRQLALCMLCITEFLLIAVEPRLCRCSWLQSASSACITPHLIQGKITVPQSGTFASLAQRLVPMTTERASVQKVTELF